MNNQSPAGNNDTAIGISMNNPTATNDWLQKTFDNLSGDDFIISENVGHASGTMRAVTRRTRFELTKFGYSETFFVFREFDSINADALRRFSAEAFMGRAPDRSVRTECD